MLEREAEIRTLRSEIDTRRRALNVLREEAAALEERRTVAEQGRSSVNARANCPVKCRRWLLKSADKTRRLPTTAARATVRRGSGLDARHGDSVEALENARAELTAAEQGLADERQTGSDLECDCSGRELRISSAGLADAAELAEKSSAWKASTARWARFGNLLRACCCAPVPVRRPPRVPSSSTLRIATDAGQGSRGAQANGCEIAGVDGTLTGRRNHSRVLDQQLTKLEVRLAEERCSRASSKPARRKTTRSNWLSRLEGRVWEANLEFEKRNLDEMDDPDLIAAQPRHARRDATEEELAD